MAEDCGGENPGDYETCEFCTDLQKQITELESRLLGTGLKFDDKLNLEITKLEFIFRQCVDSQDGVYSESQLDEIELSGHRLVAAAEKERGEAP